MIALMFGLSARVSHARVSILTAANLTIRLTCAQLELETCEGFRKLVRYNALQIS
jgi:hypothetical protein